MDSIFASMAESVSPGEKDKKKKSSSSKGGSTSSTSSMILAECLMGYRTRYTDVTEAVLKSIVRGLACKDSAVSRHSVSLFLRAVHAPNANLAAISKLLFPHIGLDNVVLPLGKDEPTPSAPPRSSSSEESMMSLHGINTSCPSVRATWVRVCARLAQEEEKPLPSSAPSPRTGVPSAERDKWRTELCDFLLDESERVAFAAMEGLIGCGWIAVTKMNVSSPTAFVTIPILQAIRTRLIASLASSSTPVVHYAARVARQLAQCYMKYFEGGATAPSPRRTRSMSGTTAPFAKQGSSTSVSTASESAAPHKIVLDLSNSSTNASSHSLKMPSSALLGSTGGNITARSASGAAPPAMMRKATQGPGMNMAGRGRTWTKTESVHIDEDHPLRDLKGALTIVYKNHRSTFVRAQVLSTLIWLEYSWSSFEVEELLLKERVAPQTALHDSVFEEFLERALLSPTLVPSLLRIYFEHFAHSPAKLNLSLLMNAWNRIAELGPLFRAKVLHSIFDFLDHPIKKETRTIIYHIHKVLYWYLGENGVVLAGEICGELPKSSTIANDEPHFPISNPATRAIISRLEFSITTSPWEIRQISAEALAKFAFTASYPARLRVYSFLKLVAKADGAALYPVATPFIELLDRIFALRRAWAFTYQSGGKLSLANLVQLQSDIDDLCNDLAPYCDVGSINPIGADLDQYLASSNTSHFNTAATNSSNTFPADSSKTSKSTGKRTSESPSKRLASEASASAGIGTDSSSATSTKVPKKGKLATGSAAPTANMLSSVNATLAATAADDAPVVRPRKVKPGSSSDKDKEKDKDKDKEKKSKKEKAEK